MDMNTCFPSDFLKASDLQDKEVTVTMSHVEMTELGSEQKPVLYFAGKDKGLVLNKTNCNTIIGMYGPNSDGWKGKRIAIFPTQTDFQGRQVACIRVKILQAQRSTPAAPPEADEIPF